MAIDPVSPMSHSIHSTPASTRPGDATEHCFDDAIAVSGWAPVLARLFHCYSI